MEGVEGMQLIAKNNNLRNTFWHGGIRAERFNILMLLYSYTLILLYSYILILLYSYTLILLYSYTRWGSAAKAVAFKFDRTQLTEKS